MSSQAYDLKPGSKVGKYSVVRILGRGAMGTVYLVRHETLDAYFALKTLDPSIAAKDAQFVARFMREAKLCCHIRHPNLIAVHDAGRDEGSGLYYLVMDYASGGTLRDRLTAAGGRLPPDEACRIAREIASALVEAERQGMVHRDIKPENVMFDADGKSRLSDLGLAKASGGDSLKTQADVVFGTPAYMSPEQAYDSARVDCRADVYSLGVVFFEMLAGKRPFEGDTALNIMAKVISPEPVPDVRTLRPEVPKAVAELVRAMCVKDVALRTVRAADVVAGLSAGVGAEVAKRNRRRLGCGVLVGLTFVSAVLVGALAVMVVLPELRKDESGRRPVVSDIAVETNGLDQANAERAAREAEERRLKEAQAAVEAERRKLAEEKRLAALRKAEAERAAKEAEEKRRALELTRREEEKKATRERQLAEERQREEAARLAERQAALEAEEKRIAEEKRKAEEARQAEDARRKAAAAEKRRQEELAEKRRAEEAKRVAEKERMDRERREREERARQSAAAEKARQQVKTYAYAVTFVCHSAEEVAALKAALVDGKPSFKVDALRDNVTSGGLFGSDRHQLTGTMTIRSAAANAPNGLEELRRHLLEHYRGDEPVDWSHFSRISCYQNISSAVNTGAGEKISP